MEADNEEQMKSKISKIVEKLIKERQEYRALIEETKEINYELYKMMISAEENHNGALYSSEISPTGSDESSTCNSDASKELQPSLNKKVFKKGSEDIINGLSDKDTHLRRTKSEKVRKRSFKKAGRVAIVKPKIMAAKDSKKILEADKESESLIWAQDILMKEYIRRNELRKNSKVAVKKANSKLETLNAFKHLLSVMKHDVSSKSEKREGSVTSTTGSNSSEPTESSNTVDKVVETKSSPSRCFRRNFPQ